MIRRKNKHKFRKFLCFVIVNLVFISNLYSADTLKSGSPEGTRPFTVYIDCGRCYKSYIRTEMTYVNYVRDRKDADVHILVTDSRTGSGGREYTLAFMGQRGYAGMSDTLRYYSEQTDTEDIIREGLLNTMKLGLTRYLSKTALAENIKITFKGSDTAAKAEDPWDHWVFKIYLNGSVNGEESKRARNMHSHVSINRITEELKLRLGCAYYGLF
jgi:hypothetical protein